MENLPAAPELLMGTVAGVIVRQTDPGKYKIRIRTGIYNEGRTGINPDPLLLIDGVKHDMNYLNVFPVSLIERIDVLKSIGKTAVYGLDGNFGVISVITRSGNRMMAESEPVKHTLNTRFSGYDSPRIFYSPRHDTTQPSFIPDLRTTLFWKPDISLQAGRELLLYYFNADNSSTIRIIVEGITSTGIPVTGTAEYQVTD